MHVRTHTYLPTDPPTHPPIHPSIHLSIYLSIYLSFVYLSIYPSIDPIDPSIWIYLSYFTLPVSFPIPSSRSLSYCIWSSIQYAVYTSYLMVSHPVASDLILCIFSYLTLSYPTRSHHILYILSDLAIIPHPVLSYPIHLILSYLIWPYPFWQGPILSNFLYIFILSYLIYVPTYLLIPFNYNHVSGPCLGFFVLTCFCVW